MPSRGPPKARPPLPSGPSGEPASAGKRGIPERIGCGRYRALRGGAPEDGVAPRVARRYTKGFPGARRRILAALILRLPLQLASARITRLQAGVAQLVEQLICNQPVGGSNPFARPTTES